MRISFSLEDVSLLQLEKLAKSLEKKNFEVAICGDKKELIVEKKEVTVDK